jgi:membrane-associated protease RseP (regulator of RpoE activity)
VDGRLGWWLKPLLSIVFANGLRLPNGIYTVPVLINGVLPLQFVLDSGAGDVSIPADVFLTLIRTGTIVKEDYIGKGGYRLADGSTIQSDRFFIRELKVGNKILRHVSASVGSVDSSLLLGQSFLKRFASVQIDNNRNVLVLGDERIDVPTFSNSLPSPPAASMYSPESRPNTATALPATNQASRGRIGVKIQDHITGQHEEPSDTPEGATIAEVEVGGPADRAGIKPGDIILAVDGAGVHSGADLLNRILSAPIGRDIHLSVVRRGNLSMMSVQVEPVTRK